MTPSPTATARLAGAVYLLVIACGLFGILYVPNTLIDWGDSFATLSEIRKSERLYRLGIVAELTAYAAHIPLALLLYRLLDSSGTLMAAAMVALALVGVPITFSNMQNKLAVLTLISNLESNLITQTAADQAMYHLRAYGKGILIAQIFWGLWLLPFGILVLRSRVLPILFGILLIAGCFGYLTDFIGRFLWEGYGRTSLAAYTTLPATVGEIGACVWLLLFGVTRHYRRD